MSTRSGGGNGDLTADIDTIVHDYFATLSTKDDDIFRLYEDNKRLRDVAEESLRHRAELETHVASQNLLIETLRTEMSERRHLAEAQEAESRVLREGAAALRAAIGLPSCELTVTLDDAVEEVRHLMNDRLALEDALDALDRGARSMGDAYARLLMDEERRARRRLEEAASLPLAGSSVGELHKDLAAFAIHSEAALAQLRQQTTQELADVQEQRAWEAHHASLQVGQVVSALEEERAQRQRSAAAAEMRELVDGERLCRQGNYHSLRCEPLVEALAGRCSAAERRWRELHAELVALTERHDTQALLLVRTEEEARRANVSLAHEREALAKLRRQHEKDEAAKKELAACQERLSDCTKELEGIKDKHVALCQKLVVQRQQYSSAVKEATDAVAELQGQVRELQRRNVYLEDRAASLQDEVKGKAKRVHVLERKTADAAAAHKAAEAKWSREHEEAEEKHQRCIRELAEEVERSSLLRLEAECRHLKESHHAQQDALQKRHERALAELADAHRWEMDRQAQHFQKENNGLAREIEEWVALVDQLRNDLRALQAQLATEHAARAVLEQQQQTESVLLDRVKQQLEQSWKEKQEAQQRTPPPPPPPSQWPRGSSGLGVEGYAEEECELLKKQVRTLEEACRRSTAVIAELREAQYRGSHHSTPRRQHWPQRSGTRLSFFRESNESTPPRQQVQHQSMLSALIADMDRDD